MKIIVKDFDEARNRRLRMELGLAAGLRCAEHDQARAALTIRGRDHGRFDARWTACCSALARNAAATVKERC
jgi:hypothetical protein